VHARIGQIVILASIILAGVHAGSVAVSAASSAASAPQSVASSPRWAVLRIIRPFYDRSAQNDACNALAGKLAACPITPRLRAALARELQWERAHTRGGNANEFCRCQNTPRKVIISGVKAPFFNASGTFAEVDTIWYWSTKPVNISWMTRRVHGGWQVDNSVCAGFGQKSDLYHIPIGPCPAT